MRLERPCCNLVATFHKWYSYCVVAAKVTLYSWFLKCLSPLSREGLITTGEARPRLAACPKVLPILPECPRIVETGAGLSSGSPGEAASFCSEEHAQLPVFPLLPLLSAGVPYPSHVGDPFARSVVHFAGASKAQP